MLLFTFLISIFATSASVAISRTLGTLTRVPVITPKSAPARTKLTHKIQNSQRKTVITNGMAMCLRPSDMTSCVVLPSFCNEDSKLPASCPQIYENKLDDPTSMFTQHDQTILQKVVVKAVQENETPFAVARRIHQILDKVAPVNHPEYSTYFSNIELPSQWVVMVDTSMFWQNWEAGSAPVEYLLKFRVKYKSCYVAIFTVLPLKI